MRRKTSSEQAGVRLEWGHPLLVPDGSREVRIPNHFTHLKRLGLVRMHRELGIYQLTNAIYEFTDPQYDALVGPLRLLLGLDYEGPEWTSCYCVECQQQYAHFDKTPLPRALVNAGYVRDYERRNRIR